MSINSYEIIAEKLSFPASKKLLDILEYLMSPEQAKMVVALPGTAQEVAEKTGLDVQDVKKGLDDLFLKGVVFPRGNSKQEAYYRFARSVLQLHDATQASGKLDPEKDKRFFQLWHSFAPELYPFMVKYMKDMDEPLQRVVPAYHAIKGLPDVQPWENFREILKASDPIAVTPCPCRLQTTAISNPCEYTRETEEWTCLQLGRGAQYVITRGSGKQLTQEEALKLIDNLEEKALVHIWSYYATMDWFMSCQCCQDCCVIFQSMEYAQGDISKAYAKSRYRAFINAETCSGCQNCLERCQFNAIDLVKVGKKYKAVVDQDKCWGCGVCVIKCKPSAIYLEAIYSPDHIPTN